MFSLVILALSLLPSHGVSEAIPPEKVARHVGAAVAVVMLMMWVCVRDGTLQSSSPSTRAEGSNSAGVAALETASIVFRASVLTTERTDEGGRRHEMSRDRMTRISRGPLDPSDLPPYYCEQPSRMDVAYNRRLAEIRAQQEARAREQAAFVTRMRMHQQTQAPPRYDDPPIYRPPIDRSRPPIDLDAIDFTNPFVHEMWAEARRICPELAELTPMAEEKPVVQRRFGRKLRTSLGLGRAGQREDANAGGWLRRRTRIAVSVQ